jgi:hypothetical protein
MSILGFLGTRFELLRIRFHQSIELVELYLELFWNALERYLGESGLELLESGAYFTYVLSMINFNQEEKQIWILKLYGKNDKSFLRLDEIVLSERLKKKI